jgi:D-arabinose 1-dehydrogenase-like Zn-dependent alcohol dehydrogenase
MKALRLKEIGLLSLEETPLLHIRNDEALIKISHCAIRRTDAKAWQNGQRDLVLPRILGHEICRKHELTGERYVVWPGKSCGTCEQ